ncbi:protein phosphatase 1 regulatory subunit 12A-like isoform X3 [Phlebotomus argentipes]|uniref:protein phosphatase 1 regulatory subunit 12A-like isoform X3 n=1 Tax=Phlebotomus argentipes TaxID=94469 RepID=UPI002892A58F|nr:protein phosphatase 1 regulatory subunit 12A-like isoform X3 [Phlebotomus argentipes]
MSFRVSRSRNIEPALTRRRSLSQSRLESSAPSSSWSNRPLSGTYYGGNTVANLRNQYQSKYGSKESLYSPTSRKSFFSGSNGYGQYSNGSDSRYGSNSNLYNSSYSDRYVSPYSNYDNGVTTAGLSLSLGTSGRSSYGHNGSWKRDYTPSRSNNLISSSNLSGSNTSLNSYACGNGSSSISRSQSFRDADRSSRSRTRNRGSASVRSISASSEKSEGYESGNEQPSSRSRLQSSSSADKSESKSEAADVEENGELIDYKALYEASRVEIEQLKSQLQKKEESLQSTKAALERFTNATTKNSLSELDKRERRAMERKLSEMEEELKQQECIKTENQRLKDENGALIRVISKLSK